jgi:hypothetical protein
VLSVFVFSVTLCFYSETLDSDLTFPDMSASDPRLFIYYNYFFVTGPVGKRSLGTFRRRSENNIKMGLKRDRMACMDWMTEV